MAKTARSKTGDTSKAKGAPKKKTAKANIEQLDVAAKSGNSDTAPSPKMDAEMLAKITELRSKVHETFGQVALAMMVLPRYRHLSISDLGSHVLEPLMRDRIAIAAKPESEGEIDRLAGVAIWASVTEEVDEKIREQVKNGVFPIRLKGDEWNGGSINWLLDVIAPTARMTTSVIANLRQIVKDGDVRIHPLVTKLVEPEALKKMGAVPIKGQDKQ